MTDNREPKRSIRIGDDLWNAARRAVKRRGDGSISNVVRSKLTQYVRDADGSGGHRASGSERGQASPYNRGANRDDRSNPG